MYIPRGRVEFVLWFRSHYQFEGDPFLLSLCDEIQDRRGLEEKVRAYEIEIAKLREERFKRTLERYNVQGDMNITNRIGGIESSGEVSVQGDVVSGNVTRHDQLRSDRDVNKIDAAADSHIGQASAGEGTKQDLTGS